MNGAPEVSIVTPTKNRLQLLCQTIDSVCQQTFDNWELIVVDDGSDDGTAEEVLQRAARDSRIRYRQREGELKGANVCRNLGLKESRAEYIIFLDSDDLLEPSCLGNRIEKMKRNLDLDFATFQAGVFQERIGDLQAQFNPHILGDDLLRFLYLECPWQTTAPIWRKSYLVQLGGFDEQLPSWQDVDLHIRAICAGAKYIRFPEIDNFVRWQDDGGKVSVMQRRSPAHLRAAETILEKFETIIRQGPGMDWSRQRALCSLFFFVAENWINIGNRSEALRTWDRVRQRQLGTPTLDFTGAMLLYVHSLKVFSGRLTSRLIHKWKGWMKLRLNPELVK